MKLNALMIVNTVVAGVFGLGFVFAPGQVTAFYSSEGGAVLNYVAQLLGAALLAFAFVTWFARNAADSEARRAILLAMFVGDAVGFIVALSAQLRGIQNAIGWSTVAIYLLLALGFGYFRFIAQEAQAPAQ